MKQTQPGNRARRTQYRFVAGGMLSCLSLLTLGNVCLAQSESPKPVSRVANPDRFAIGGTGITGAVSSGEKQLWMLIQTKDRSRLVAMANDKNGVSQLYGMLGLRFLNAPEYRSVLGELKRSKGEVETLAGCIGGMDRVANIAARIEKGGYDKQRKYDMEHRRK